MYTVDHRKAKDIHTVIQMDRGIQSLCIYGCGNIGPNVSRLLIESLLEFFSGLMINLISVLPSSLSHSLPEIVMLSFFSLPSFAAQLSLLMSPLLLSGLLTKAECDALKRLGKSFFFHRLALLFQISDLV